MAMFENCVVVLELKNLPYKEREFCKSLFLENGAKISLVVNKQCSMVVASDVNNLSSSRLRSIQKYKIPVVDLNYVYGCTGTGVRQPVELFMLEIPPSGFSPARLRPPTQREFPPASPTEENTQSGNVLEKFRIYAETDFSLPRFPDHFEVAKYTIFERNNSWCVLELQSVRVNKSRRYRVVKYCMDLAEAKKAAVKDQLVFPSTSEEALDVYKALRESIEMSGLEIRPSMPPQIQDLGSAALQQLLLEEKLNIASVSQEVGAFVELLWTEALGCLANVLLVPINKLSLNDVTRAEGLLLQAQKKRKDADPLEAAALLKEVYDLLPHREPRPPEPSASFLSQKLDLCQLIRDVLNVSEMTLWSSTPSSVGKYRAMRCSVEVVPPSSSEFQDVARLLQHSSLQIHQIVRVSRRAELQTFNSELSNTRALLHSSNPTNFVGILSRGLLLPRVGVELHGIQRTDVGNLGSGIYFSDSLSTSLKYSKPSETDGSRMLLVCDVALGNCKDFLQKDPTLTHAPLGYHSVHGVRHTGGSHSDFEDDEYVVYSPDQVKLKYVVRFSVDGEQLKEFRPAVDTSITELEQQTQELEPDEEQTEEVKNPRDDLKPGLQESSGLMLPLESIHVRCKLIDLLSQVIVFQKYTNLSPVPIEAKYVFPLDNSATVCGFEAFINGKHVVGQVKEKEMARREYKQAVEKGHGAYLMDQDAPDVFTISVGNLPPGASVLIKITYVSELVVSGGRINFSLPGSLAPWQVSDGLKQITQVSVDKVCVTDESQTSREFSLEMSVEMPNEILYLKSYTHQIKTKRTDCKAVISVVPGQPLHPEGFELSIGFSNIHLPRMWVENHPDKDSQACMLVFYPDFEAKSDSAAEEVILLLDTSESMRGESLRSAQRIALKLLHHLSHSFRLNVILFGSDHKEAFLKAQPVSEVCQDAESFIKSCSLVGGSTELWRPLRALSLLPPSCGVRNLLLLSDGHIQNPELTLQLIRDGAPQSRLFTCGFSSTANRHMLRALAQVGGGAYEFFDAKAKHNWEEKMLRQVGRIRSPGCSSVSVKWQQFSSMAPPPVQAPMQLNALFNDCHTLVYGFVPHCTQATLFGNLCGQELRTLVSTSELQKTRGTFLHKLTARAIIRDYEDGNLDSSEAEHEGKKEELKSFIIELSKEYSILSQFTSFVAIEERDSQQPESGFTDIPKLIAEEDVDFLPYVDWTLYPPKNQDFSALMNVAEYYMKKPPQLKASTPRSARGARRRGSCRSRRSHLDSPPLPPPPPPLISPADAPTYAPTAPGAMLYGTTKSLSQPYECIATAVSPMEFSASRVELSAPQLEGTFELFPSSSKSLRIGAPPPLPQSLPAGGSAYPPVATEAIMFEESPDECLISSVITPCAMEEESEFVQPLASRDISELEGHHGGIKEPPPPRYEHGALTRCQFRRNCRSRRSPSPPPIPPADAYASTMLCGASTILSQPYECIAGAVSPMEFSAASDLEALMMCDAPPVAPPLSAPPPPPAPIGSDVLGQISYLLPDESSPLPPRRQADGPASIPIDQAIEPTDGMESRWGNPQVRWHCSRDPTVSSSGLFGSAAIPNPTVSSSGLFGSAAIPPLGSLSFRDLLPPPRPCGVAFSREAHDKLKEFRCSKRLSSRPVHPKWKWKKIFQLQQQEGFWELTNELGLLLNLNVDVFANVFLMSKGIKSLGPKAHEDILRMCATLLVLQLMRVEKMEEGKLLRSLFHLEETPSRLDRWTAVKKAVDWVRWAERQYPCIYSRLEFGLNWESSTRQLLGVEGLPPFSPLIGLNLRQGPTPMLVQ